MMRSPLGAALVLALALPGSARPAAGASPSVDEVPPDWVTIKNDSETFQLKVPPGFKDLETKNVYRVRQLQYSGEPFLSMMIKVYAYPGQNDLGHFVAFCKKDVGGSAHDIEGAKDRFYSTRTGSEGTDWRNCVIVRVTENVGYYMDILVPQKVFDDRAEDIERILASFETFAAPKDSYTLPAGWKEVKNEVYAVMGPVAEQSDPKAKAFLENRLFRVQTWADPTSKPFRHVREFFLDQRKFVAREVIKVCPTRGDFRKMAGDLYEEGFNAVFVPSDADHGVIVDGSAESGLDEHELSGALAVQYMHRRIPDLPPWLAAGFRIYWENASRRDFAGLFPPEVMKRAKEVFRRAPKLESLLKMDAAALREKGEEARVACWGFIQYALHGPDEPVRNAFRGFVREAVDAESLDKLWQEKFPKFKPRDWDKAAQKYIKDYEL